METKNKISSQALFMPTLLDRLCPSSSKLGHGRHISRSAYRQTVLRDLQWLLNCQNIESQSFVDGFLWVRRSVLNYGVPAFAGGNFTEDDLLYVAQAIKEAILRYEPRVMKKTLKVGLVQDAEIQQSPNKALFRIEASLWFEPYPVELVVRAQWDSENGNMQLQDCG